MLAKELGIDLSQVEGTGTKGMVTRADVQRFADARSSAAPPEPNRALAAMAATVASSKRDIPHFYATRDLEVSSAAQWRDRWNATQNGNRVSFNDVFVRCAARALADVPRLNVAYENGAFAQRTTADILLVVAREPALLLMPVGDPRSLDWKDLVHRLHDTAAPANATAAAPLLAISNLGMYGVKEFAAIIPPGCSSVLAIGAVRDAPVVRNGSNT